MIRVNNIKIYPPDELSAEHIAKKMGIDEGEITEYKVFKRSVDARRKNDVHYNYTVDVCVRNEKKAACGESVKKEDYIFEKGKKKTKPPVVVGSGPAGLMCALMLAENGYCPILLERGAAVEERTRLVRRFWEKGEPDEDTNIQFGEGGAGTFSDGKLNTGIKDKRCRYILEEFVRFGAPESILYEAKPHVGTDYLSRVVKGIRNRIIECGGEVRFKNKLTDVLIKDGRVIGAQVQREGEEYVIETDDLVLAVGHSAFETVKQLARKNVSLCRKAFSVGVRIEHSQEMINRSQYGVNWRYFGNADYKLSYHLSNGRGVYTFCMCPGGYVVNSASERGGVVTNGMSYYKRDGKNANSAVLVSVLPEDLPGNDPLEGFRFQRDLEKTAYEMGGGNYFMPAQTVGDFLNGKPSKKAGEVVPTVRPGVRYCDLSDLFAPFVTDALKEALPMFDKKLRGFATPGAVLTAPETRSSSPVRILRTAENLQAVGVRGLYPCGEGAGYAGGIMSAAADGIRCAEAVVKS